ncbi:MAG: hypothetical protein ABSG53_02055 [Thermoguttaceae bacterium]|jgi:hypothetical protein
MWCICREARKLAASVLLILPGILTLGCDRSPPVNPEVPTEKRILMLVEDVDDFSQSEKELGRIKPLFVLGSEPSKETLLRYMAYRYDGQRAVQSGDSATVAVIVKDAKTGNPVGEMQWSMVKINGVWKLKEAPLPAS